nr:uncharacterized protein LOC109172756 [Ipomoea trifida]
MMMMSKRQSRSVLWWFGIAFQLLVLLYYCSVMAAARSISSPLTLKITKKHVVMDNGLIKVTLSNPTGAIAGIQYNGIDNLLESSFRETNRGYWDIVWSKPDMPSSLFNMLPATNFTVIAQDESQIEVSFTITFNPDDDTSVPMNFDKRYVMLPGRSGFYSYAIYDHPQGWPDVNIDETRLAIKLSQNMFHYMAISDDIQRVMPSANDRSSGQTLEYKEAVLLTDPTNPKLKGQVDDKYQYSLESKDMDVHGWVCTKPHVGFWVITGSDEFRSGGPIKQDLTSHVGPTSLSTFFSGHYAGDDFGLRLRNGEAWKKVFGPVFLYLNRDSSDNPRVLWEDAKQQMLEETKSWPYNFPKSKDYVAGNLRGTIIGQLIIRDRHMNKEVTPAKSARIGLAPPGEAGSWQHDVKGYQFWTQTDSYGHFEINAIRPGNYSLYAWIPGILGDYKYNVDLNIKSGDNINVGDLVYNPPRNGPTLWEIGIPDKKAAEFFIPEPAPDLMNYAFNNQTQNFRQYGLWDRYTDLYPDKDLVYQVGKSDYTKDWFFAHVNRRVGKKTYVPTTWKISFPLENVNRTGTYTLRIALASSSYATIQVWINSENTIQPRFTINGLGRDNAIARHGIHGLYSEHSFDIPGLKLVKGENTIYLRQPRGGNPFFGVMYDYIRLEGPNN